MIDKGGDGNSNFNAIANNNSEFKLLLKYVELNNMIRKAINTIMTKDGDAAI